MFCYCKHHTRPSMDYFEEVKYVKKYLEEHGGELDTDVDIKFRSRIRHTCRVLEWVERLLDDDTLGDVNEKILYIAAIYHDIGYDKSGRAKHAERSYNIFMKRALDLKLTTEEIEKTAFIIKNHSNKELIKDNIPIELCLLMEADLMDEIGAMGIMWDCMIMGAQGAQGYSEVLEHIKIGYNKLINNPMKTKKAIMYWEQKRVFVENFLQMAQFELEEKEETYDKI